MAGIVRKIGQINGLMSQIRCFASKVPAQGDTLRPEGRRGAEEIAQGAKGDELVADEKLKYNTITDAAQAFKGDLRSTSALGLGDGLYTHTDKWYQVATNLKSWMSMPKLQWSLV